MRCLLLSQVFPPQTGGSGRWFWEVYRRLPPDRVRVMAGEYAGAREFDAGHDLAIRRLPLAFPSFGIVSWSGMKRYLATAKQIRQWVRSEAIAELHCGRVLAEGLLGWLVQWQSGIPYLCYVHGEELSFPGRELIWLRRRVFKGARLVIANSRNTCRILREQWQVPDRKLRLLHPGVDIERFVPAERDEAVRERLGWRGRPVVLTVGRLQRRKGHDMLIRALPEIRRHVPDVLYAIVGDGEERPALEQLTASLGLGDCVRFHGESGDDELIRCYQQCDLFVLPNRTVGGDFEGFGMVLLEAQACGKPVVAGASGGTAETMSIPATGEIVPCDGPEQLAECIARLLTDPARRKSMGAAARDWVVQHFAWESLTRQAAELFWGPESAAPSTAATCEPAAVS